MSPCQTNASSRVALRANPSFEGQSIFFRFFLNLGLTNVKTSFILVLVSREKYVKYYTDRKVHLKEYTVEAEDVFSGHSTRIDSTSVALYSSPPPPTVSWSGHPARAKPGAN